MKTRLLVIGMIILISTFTLSVLGLIAGQELNNQGDTDIFPDDWSVQYNPAIGYTFAWATIILIPATTIGISITLYSLLSKYAKPIAIGIGFSLFCAYVGIVAMGYPYT